MTQTTSGLPALRVVLVEDDTTMRLFLKETLENHLGHQVVGEAGTGTDMVRTVLELEPDVVVFDIHLPRLNGLDALQQIYQERVVAAVAITAALMWQGIRDFKTVGCYFLFLVGFGIFGFWLPFVCQPLLRGEYYIIGRRALQKVTRGGRIVHHIPYDNVKDVDLAATASPPAAAGDPSPSGSGTSRGARG